MKNSVEHFDVAILGGGPAGYVGAIRTAQLGKTVCVIEKEELGGTCLLHGCIPTKAFLSASELFYKFQHSEEFGIHIEGNLKLDYPKIVQRKNHIITLMSNGIKSLLKNYQIPFYYGSGYLKNSKTIEISPTQGPNKLISADNILICTGARPADIPGFPFDGKRILSSTDILRLTEIPKSLLVLGAGATGCEFAFTFAELGTQVTVVEMMPHAMPTEDEEISEILERQFRKRKIRLLTDTRILSLDMADENMIIAHLNKGEPVHAEQILVSIGRTFNSQNLGLEDIGIKMGPKKETIVNEHMETSIPSIYAAGDITGKMLLAHVASAQAIVAVENISGKHTTMDYSAIPWNTFTHPPLSRVGLTEKQCIAEKRKIKIGKFQFRILGAAQITGELDGMVKVIADANTDVILGVHIIGPRSSELIHEAVLAVKMKITAQEWGEVIHSHPTLSEAVMEAIHNIHDKSIHSPKKNH